MRSTAWWLRMISTFAALLVCTESGSLKAQDDRWVSPYRLLLTYEHAAALAEAAERRLDYVPGEVIIKFKDGVSVAGQQRALEALRSRPLPDQLNWTGKLAVLRDHELNSSILAAQLNEQPEIEYAEPNYLYRRHSTPNDPSYSTRQWNFTAIDLPRAWDINPGATASITVAVLDTGVTSVNQTFVFPAWDGDSIRNISVPFAVNPDLGSNRLTAPRDFVFWEGPILDTEGHGTHVSSTIGEDTNNGIGLAGIAYNAKIMPVKVCASYWDVQFILSDAGFPGFAPLDVGGCDAATVAQGVRYAADNGAKVINLSLGGPEPSETLRQALLYAIEKGAFISISMGNSFEDGNPTQYPAAYASGIDGAMAVAAVGRSLVRGYYSNTGSHTEISAPGGSVRDGGSAGQIWQATIALEDSDPERVTFPRFDRYSEIPQQGTSMAAPHVAGIAALIITQGVTKPAAVEAIIKKTAKDLGTPGRDDEYGYGLIQPRAALFGFGIGK